MNATRLPLKFQIGARTLWSIERRLVRVPLSLDQALAGTMPNLPDLPADAHGYWVTSLPQALIRKLEGRGLLAFVRQRYTRYHADLTLGVDGWMQVLSANTRSQLRRKTKKLAAASGSALAIERFRTPEAMGAFYAEAREVAARTYQEKLLGSALPDSAHFRRKMIELAMRDAVRAWLLRIDGRPVAYLYCPVEDGVVLYAYVGHDPDFADLSPGAVLHFEAMHDLLREHRFRRFDFTEGEGQHKRQLATDGIACADLLLLRPNAGNRAALAALGAFDGAVARAKTGIRGAGLDRAMRTLRRG